MAYVRFTCIGPSDEVIPLSTLELRDSSDVIVFRDDIGFRADYYPEKPVSLDEDTYYASVRADGYIFPHRDPVVVALPNPNEGATGLSPDNPLVVEIQATGYSKSPEDVLPVTLYGWGVIPQDPHLDDGEVDYTGFGGSPTTNYPTVVLTQLSETGEDMGPPLNTTTKSVDRNGYFEVDVLPDAIYQIRIPGRGRSALIRTPDTPGVRSEAHPIIQSSRQIPVSEL